MENERKKGYNKKTKYRVCTFLISLIFACTIWTGRVMARDLINLNQRHTLTVEYPCADTSFQIYKVADVSETGSYTLTETFAKSTSKNYTQKAFQTVKVETPFIILF